MTGTAQGQSITDQGQLHWELRSINHRFLEINLRLPEELREFETEAREQIAQTIKRGKIDANLRWQAHAGTATPHIDPTALQQLLGALHQLSQQCPSLLPPNGLELLRWPGILQATPVDMQRLRPAITQLLAQALEALAQHRRREGERLAQALQTRTTALRRHLAQIQLRAPQAQQAARAQLEQRLRDLPELEPHRVAQEITLLLQRLDVSEEIDRLSAHLAELERVMHRDEPVGRRLDFLLQEMNREINTLGSKSNDWGLSQQVIEVKVILEQFREQLQNIE